MAQWNRLLPVRRCFYLAIALLLVTVGEIAAQRIEVGVMGGGSPSTDFQPRIRGPFVPGATNSPYESDVGGYVVGPTVSLRVTPRLFVSLDALYKPLHYRMPAAYLHGELIGFAPATVVTWQFPVLARYELTEGQFRPFLEGGPSFRSSGNLNSANPSGTGATVGAGVSIPWRSITFSPRIRYTRWADDPESAGVRTKPDQVEFLLGATYSGATKQKLLGRRVSLGAVFGAYASESTSTEVSSVVDPQTGDAYTTQYTRGPRRLILGPALIVDLAPRLSLEVNALTRGYQAKFRLDRTFNGVPGPVQVTNLSYPWEFPVLARYHFTDGVVRPFVAVGPAFRLPKEQAGAWMSNYGLALGAGAEIPWKVLRFAPSVRYTRWGKDRSRGPSNVFEPDTGVPRDQIYLLFSATF